MFRPKLSLPLPQNCTTIVETGIYGLSPTDENKSDNAQSCGNTSKALLTPKMRASACRREQNCRLRSRFDATVGLTISYLLGCLLVAVVPTTMSFRHPTTRSAIRIQKDLCTTNIDQQSRTSSCYNTNAHQLYRWNVPPRLSIVAMKMVMDGDDYRNEEFDNDDDDDVDYTSENDDVSNIDLRSTGGNDTDAAAAASYDFGEEDLESAGVVIDDLSWRVEKLRLEEANTRRFLKAKPRFLPYEECRKWVQAWGRWTSEEDWYVKLCSLFGWLLKI